MKSPVHGRGFLLSVRAAYFSFDTCFKEMPSM